MKPIKLGEDTYAKNQYKNDLRRITKHISDFFQIADKYVKTDNKNDLKPNLYKSFLDKIEAQYRPNFPIISVEKICEFLEIELHALRKISADVSALNIDIDYNTFEALEPDFSIYATTKEEIEKCKELEPLCAVLNQYLKSSKTIYPFDIIRGTGQVLSYDGEVFKPSVTYILHSHRF
jgi:hypothetical protein